LLLSANLGYTNGIIIIINIRQNRLRVNDAHIKVDGWSDLVTSKQPKIKPHKVTVNHINFVDNRRKHTTRLPAELTGIKRVDSINIRQHRAFAICWQVIC